MSPGKCRNGGSDESAICPCTSLTLHCSSSYVTFCAVHCALLTALLNNQEHNAAADLCVGMWTDLPPEQLSASEVSCISGNFLSRSTASVVFCKY